MTQKNQFAIAVLAAFIAFTFAGGIQASETAARALHVERRMSVVASHIDRAVERQIGFIRTH